MRTKTPSALLNRSMGCM